MNFGSELINRRHESQRFRLRLLWCGLLVVLLCALLITRLIYLQMVQHEHFKTLAEYNRISIAPVPPSRGLILDRNGVVLADNFSAYTLEISPRRVADLDKTIDALSELVEISARDRKRFKKLLDESRNFDRLPIRNRLSEDEVARFAVNRFRFPGVEINARLFRSYPRASSASHVIGYIGRINDDDLERIEDAGLLANYRGSDHMGKIGIEQSYEKELHGSTGFEQLETDAGGHTVRSLSRNEATSGNDVLLSIDIKLQEVAEKIFAGRRGALVALEPSSGEVLAFVSQPGYDPNLFVDGIDQTSWEALNESPDKPLTNRALRGQYPPGSTIKPFMALAALTLNKRSAASTIRDPGYFAFPGAPHHYRDWKAGGHGQVDLRKSIVISCDTYFYGVANDLGIDNIHSFLGNFDFGQKTAIDLEGEATGVLPSREWKKRKYRQEWYPGETVITGIGQGYNLMTPLQLAHAVAAVANNGVVMRPRLVHATRDSKTHQVRQLPSEVMRTIRFKPEHIALVRQAMVDVTRPGGTAARAGLNAEYAFAGKTGTAQVVGIKQTEHYVEKNVKERNRDHALFIAYAPAVKPQIALAVLVENGGHGGATAAPLARQVMDYYLLGKMPAGLAPADEDDEHD